jgi:dephospho-CoA kinase
MKIIGLAGGSGTGKTTLAEHLEKSGAARIDADALAHEILQTDATVAKAIRARFGDAVFDGVRIDRRALAEVVFADWTALSDLNRIVHPPVIEAITRRLERLKAGGVELVVIDAALLLEVPLPVAIDLMIGLHCSPAEQLRRLRAKGDTPEPAIQARLASQRDIERWFDKADVVVNTEKPKADLFAEIDRLITMLLGGR